MGDQYARRYRHEADWRKILDRIIRELAIKADIDGVGRARHNQRVAVRYGLGSKSGRYVSPSPGTVVYQEGLAHGFDEFVGEEGSDDIEPAAGSVAHQHTNRLGRVGKRRVCRRILCQRRVTHQSQKRTAPDKVL